MDTLAPHIAGSDTSRAAAESQTPTRRNTGRQTVLLVIAESGWRGVTDEEIAAAATMSPSAARPRRIELYRMGKISPMGKRKTASGRDAQVWVLA